MIWYIIYSLERSVFICYTEKNKDTGNFFIIYREKGYGGKNAKI